MCNCMFTYCQLWLAYSCVTSQIVMNNTSNSIDIYNNWDIRHINTNDMKTKSPNQLRNLTNDWSKVLISRPYNMSSIYLGLASVPLSGLFAYSSWTCRHFLRILQFLVRPRFGVFLSDYWDESVSCALLPFLSVLYCNQNNLFCLILFDS